MKTVTPLAIATFLGCCERTVQRLAAAGKVPDVEGTGPRRRFYDTARLWRWAANHRDTFQNNAPGKSTRKQKSYIRRASKVPLAPLLPAPVEVTKLGLEMEWAFIAWCKSTFFVRGKRHIADFKEADWVVVADRFKRLPKTQRRKILKGELKIRGWGRIAQYCRKAGISGGAGGALDNFTDPEKRAKR
jgi:hypothetical protein